MINALVLSGQGINSHRELANAFIKAGAHASLMDIEDFLELKDLKSFDILAFPGGFSFGDEIRSGKLLAEKIRAHQLKNIQAFIQKRKPVIGICNGFQILVQLGVFEAKERTITLSLNEKNRFINDWVDMEVLESDCLWLRGISSTVKMPVRHKEGRLVVGNGLTDFKPVLRYKTNINGSHDRIAGICNEPGNVLGLMPHPEAATSTDLFPSRGELANLNQQIFNNAINYCERMNS